MAPSDALPVGAKRVGLRDPARARQPQPTGLWSPERSARTFIPFSTRTRTSDMTKRFSTSRWWAFLVMCVLVSVISERSFADLLSAEQSWTFLNAK